MPILRYGSEVWGRADIVLLACKHLLGFKVSTSNHIARGECGRYPIYIFAPNAASNIDILLNMPTTRFPRKCYSLLLLDASYGKAYWVSKMKMLLYDMGFGYIWERQFLCSINSFISEFMARAQNIYLQEWHTSLSAGSKTLLNI